MLEHHGWEQDLESVAERLFRSAREPQRISLRNCPKFWMREVEKKRKNANCWKKIHRQMPLSKAGALGKKVEMG